MAGQFALSNKFLFVHRRVRLLLCGCVGAARAGYISCRLAFLFSCSCPDSQVLDVLDDSSEGLPVSLVKHGLVDGWSASMIILAHLVVVRSNWACFLFEFFVRTRKKECNQRSGRPEFADWFALGPSDRP